ncbi:hypothetical protein PM082_014148 [Marasmius tenuissimus]|nr:hypothetical protein PM082_014148 [Marasmius tenuissimus]
MSGGCFSLLLTVDHHWITAFLRPLNPAEKPYEYILTENCLALTPFYHLELLSTSSTSLCCYNAARWANCMIEKEKGCGDSSGDDYSDAPLVCERPKGLKGLYYHPLTQIMLLGGVCFMCPGLFNAINGLGAAGRLNPTTSSNSNTALYSTFGIAAFFAGSINNVLGSKITLLLGSFGYCIYIGSYLALKYHDEATGFVIAAGAILGVCAGMLWSAQGSLMLSYPTEAEKGKYIAVFWAIFNMGSVVGAAVSFAENFDSRVRCPSLDSWF